MIVVTPPMLGSCRALFQKSLQRSVPSKFPIGISLIKASPANNNCFSQLVAGKRHMPVFRSSSSSLKIPLKQRPGYLTYLPILRAGLSGGPVDSPPASLPYLNDATEADLSSVETLNNSNKAFINSGSGFGVLGPLDKYIKELTVIRVDSGGVRDTLRYPLKQVMAGMHARDVVALGLTSISLGPSSSKPFTSPSSTGGGGYEFERPAPPLLLPRSSALFVSFGNIKASIYADHVLALEPSKPLVDAWVSDLASYLSKNGLPPDSSFELFVLEYILKEMCDTFDRRLTVYDSLVNNLLLEVDNLTDVSAGFNKLVPLKDALFQFELAVKEAQRCLLDFIDNEEDMSQLVEFARNNSNKLGINTSYVSYNDEDIPGNVEGLLENYAIRLSHCLNDIVYKQQMVLSRQSMVELGMQIQRNRLLWANLHLGVITVCMGFCTTIAGFFGMNILNGLETMPYAFTAIVSSTIGLALLLHHSIMQVTGTSTLRNVQAKQFEQRRALNSVLKDLSSIDLAMRTAYSIVSSTGDESFTKKKLSQSEFKDLVSTVRSRTPKRQLETLDSIVNVFQSTDRAPATQSEITQRYREGDGQL